MSLIVRAAQLLAETRGRASDLLRDGAEIQRLLAELHGAQRYRLGWTEGEIARDVDLLSQQIVDTIRAVDVDPEASEFIIDIVRFEDPRPVGVRLHRHADVVDVAGPADHDLFAKSAGKR